MVVTGLPTRTLYTKMDWNPSFLFLKSPQLQKKKNVFVCPSLFIVIFFLILHVLISEHKEATKIVATKLLSPLPLPPKL